MHIRRLVVTGTAAAAIFALGAAVPARASATTGLLVVTANTTLTQDHVGNIWFGADSVTLDCAGHSVIGPGGFGTWPLVGIAAVSRTGVTIRNCRVSGFGHGISLSNVTSFSVIDNTSSGNESFGLAMNADAHGTVSGNTLTSNGRGGVGIGGPPEASDIRFIGNTAARNAGYGFITFVPYPYAHFQPGYVFSGNVSTENANSGFVIASGNDEVTLSGNQANNNGDDGFELYYSDGARIDGNSSSHNVGAGFDVQSSTGHTFTNNTATDNTGAGFFLPMLTSSTLNHNVAIGNRFGFTAWGATGMSFDHNVANNNERGFVFDLNATGNTLTKNVANSNTLTGFRFYPGSIGNTIANCVAHANGAPDAVDENALGSNTWLHNSFGSMWTP